MATPAPVHSGGDRFEVAETRVNVPPEMQCLQTADAALSEFASRYLAYRHKRVHVADLPSSNIIELPEENPPHGKKDQVIPDHQGRPPDRVSQFTQISGPFIFLKQFNHILIKTFNMLS